MDAGASPRHREFLAVYGFGETQMRTRAIDCQRARTFVVFPGTGTAAVVRSHGCAATFGCRALPGFEPRLAAHDIAERTVAAKAEYVVKPARAFVRARPIGGS